MNGFDLPKRDKNLVISHNLFSVPCVISNNAEEQETRCIGNFIGIQNTTDGENNPITFPLAITLQWYWLYCVIQRSWEEAGGRTK
jgi:hypothetical protein